MKRLGNLRSELAQSIQLGTADPENEHTQRELCDRLLMWEASVTGKESIERLRGQPEQLAIRVNALSVLRTNPNRVRDRCPDQPVQHVARHACEP
jgi:hypothetical protein